MSKLETTKRYHLIINKLRTAKRVNFAEIAGYLRLQSGIDGLNYNISLRTFQRDIQGIGSIFGIYIKFDFSGKFILSKNLNRKRTTGFLKPSICLTHLKPKKNCRNLSLSTTVIRAGRSIFTDGCTLSENVFSFRFHIKNFTVTTLPSERFIHWH